MLRSPKIVSCLVFLVGITGGLALPLLADAPVENALSWDAVVDPIFRAEDVAAVNDAELKRDAATIALNGLLALGRPGSANKVSTGGELGQVFAAVFRGSGRLRLTPSLVIERQQLALHSGQEALDAAFSEAVFVFTDNTLEELAPHLTFRSSDPGQLRTLYGERKHYWTRYGVNWEPRVLKGLLSAKPEHHALFVANLKTRQHGWLTFVMDAADPEEIELQQLDVGREMMSIWTKFPAEGRQPQDVFIEPGARHEYRIHHYTLEVAVNKDAELEATAEVQFEMQHAGERVLLFAIDPNLRVSKVTNTDRRSLAFFQPDDPKDRFFLGDYLAVVAPEPFSAGENTLRFHYAGERVIRKVGSGNYFCQSFGWYPTYSDGRSRASLTRNQFAARADFDLTLRVPEKFQAVATGKKIEEDQGEQFYVSRWRSEIPLAVAGFAFGEYKVVTRKAGKTNIEVYANKNPDDMFRSLPMVGGMGRFRNPTEAGPVLLALQSMNPARLAEEIAVEVGNSLQVMEGFFGPYPYSKLAVTNIPYAYGQGWPSLLYVSILSFLDSFQRDALGLRAHVELTDTFRAHETSHQWWGHAVGWKSYHDQWLSEGFAEFSGMLYAMLRRKPEEYFRLLRESRRDLLEHDAEQKVYEQIGPLYAGRRLNSAEHPRGYSVVIYQKGAWVLHMIRMMLYDAQNPKNPDHRFMAMMKEFTKAYFNRPASTQDFQAIVEKHMLPHMDVDGNGKMDWFFDSWVYGTGIPEYEFDYKLEPGPRNGRYVLSGVLRQSGVPDDFRSLVPLFFHRGKRLIRAGWLRVRGPQSPFQVTLPFRPDKITLNEGEDVLCIIK